MDESVATSAGQDTLPTSHASHGNYNYNYTYDPGDMNFPGGGEVCKTLWVDPTLC